MGNAAKKLIDCRLIKSESKREYDRMIDLALSLLANFDDNVGRLMDYLMSTYSTLSQREWEELEAELINYVDNLR